MDDGLASPHPRLDSTPPARTPDSSDVPGEPADIDAAARLQADARLRDELARHNFDGPTYAMFEEDLAGYGFQVMMGWLASGHIFTRCRQAGMPVPAEPIPPEDREDLAQETVAETLPVFKRRALIEGGWRSDGGASLKSYFVRALCGQFVNIWRKRLRAKPAGPGPMPIDNLPDTESRQPGPDEISIQRDEIRRGLAAIPNDNTAAAIALTEDGYQQEEIAELLGPGVTKRMVEGYLRRHRQHQQHRQQAITHPDEPGR